MYFVETETALLTLHTLHYIAVQIPLSGYGGRSELCIINMPQCAQHEFLYYHSVRADSAAHSAVVSAVINNSGNQTAFVNALTFKGIQLICFCF